MTNLRDLRLAKGLTQEQLAEMIGSSQPTIQKLESGRMRLTLDYAVKLARHLDVHPDQLLAPSGGDGRGDGGVAARGRIATPRVGMPVPNPPYAPPEYAAQRALPVLAAARGGMDQEMFLEDGPIDWVAVPDYLKNAREPYGMYVVGESMMPRFRPAQLLHVNPHKPPAPGAGVVIVKKNRAVLVKEFLRHAAEGIWVREYQPVEREFLVPIGELDAVHTVVGLQEPA